MSGEAAHRDVCFIGLWAQGLPMAVAIVGAQPGSLFVPASGTCLGALDAFQC